MIFDRKKYDLDRYYRLKKERIKQLGNACVICNSINNLSFHHLNPNNKNYSIGKYWTRADVKDELTKCILLCNKCHKVPHQAKHGGRVRYQKYKCRCIECVSFWKKYLHNLNINKKKKRALLV